MSDQHANEEMIFKEVSPGYRVANDTGIDLSLLKHSLSKTPWERMQANDDAMNFAESLRSAMEKRNAKFK
jgi:hypothetical protein